MTLALRPLTASDYAAVRRIFEEGIATGLATFETAAPDWPAWDAAHLPECRLVAERDGGILGWAALSRVSGRCVYAGVAEVSVYVAQAARGGGVGSALLERLIEDSEQAGLWTLQAGIFPQNEASLALHRGHGFREVGRRERIGELHGEWRDVVLLERRSGRVGAADVAPADLPGWPVLRTERLRLDAPGAGDAASIRALAGDRDVAANTLTIPHPYPPGEAERFLAQVRRWFLAREAVTFAIRSTEEDDALAGLMGLRFQHDHAAAEVGYWIGRPFRGRGYATEALRALLAFGFDEAGLNRIYGRHFSRNAASGAVMRKAGMRHEGVARQALRKAGVFEDIATYAILRSDPR